MHVVVGFVMSSIRLSLSAKSVSDSAVFFSQQIRQRYFLPWLERRHIVAGTKLHVDGGIRARHQGHQTSVRKNSARCLVVALGAHPWTLVHLINTQGLNMVDLLNYL